VLAFVGPSKDGPNQAGSAALAHQQRQYTAATAANTAPAVAVDASARSWAGALHDDRNFRNDDVVKLVNIRPSID